MQSKRISIPKLAVGIGLGGLMAARLPSSCKRSRRRSRRPPGSRGSRRA